MADIPDAAPLSADEQTQLAALQARAEAAKAAAADAATRTMTNLITTPEFKAFLPIAEAANAAAPKELDLAYLVTCMERLADRYKTA